MRWLEVRRHSLTKEGVDRGHGSELSARGVALARSVGADLGAISYVVTSAVPRAIETAIAMGCCVDEAVDLPSGYVPGEVAHHEQWSWPRPYVRYAELLGHAKGLAAAARVHEAVWNETVNAVPEGATALVVCHGGAIEPALVTCLPNAAHASWGAPFAHCDGARLGYHGGRFVTIRFRRVSAVPGATGAGAGGRGAGERAPSSRQEEPLGPTQ
jgi:broad specificity phosphatase PhoE